MKKRWVVVRVERIVRGGRTKVVSVKPMFCRRNARRLADELNRQAILQRAARKFDLFLYTVKRADDV